LQCWWFNVAQTGCQLDLPLVARMNRGKLKTLAKNAMQW
jgi:hypothetical protein